MTVIKEGGFQHSPEIVLTSKKIIDTYTASKHEVPGSYITIALIPRKKDSLYLARMAFEIDPESVHIIDALTGDGVSVDKNLRIIAAQDKARTIKDQLNARFKLLSEEAVEMVYSETPNLLEHVEQVWLD